MSAGAVFFGSAALVALLGLALLVWALFADRSRGRKRCPKCWYDMSAAVNLRCPECGREVKHEKQLLKTRRRWKVAFATLLPFALAGFLALQPKVQRDGWWSVMPTTLMLMYFQFQQDDGVIAAIDYRMTVEFEHSNNFAPSFRVPDESAMWEWQWRWLGRTILRLLEDEGLPAFRREQFIMWGAIARDVVSDEYTRQRLKESIEQHMARTEPGVRSSASILATDHEDVEGTIARILPLLEDDNERVKYSAMGSLRLLLHSSGSDVVVRKLIDLLSHRDPLIQDAAASALQSLAGREHDLEAEVKDALRAAHQRAMETNGEFRYRFVSAFARFAERSEWVPWIREALHTNDPVVRGNAIDVLLDGLVDPGEFLGAVLHELQSTEATEQGRQAAAHLLRRWQSIEQLREHMNVLIELTKHDDPLTSESATHILIRFDPTWRPGYRDYP